LDRSGREHRGEEIVAARQRRVGLRRERENDARPQHGGRHAPQHTEHGYFGSSGRRVPGSIIGGWYLWRGRFISSGSYAAYLPGSVASRASAADEVHPSPVYTRASPKRNGWGA